MNEACSHEGALLFHCFNFDRRQSNPTVTDLPAYWAQGPKQVLKSLKKVSEICFRNAKTMFRDATAKRKKDILFDESNLPPKIQVETFLRAVKNANCVVWQVMPPFCFVKTETFPHVYFHLYEEKYSKLSADELINIGKRLQYLMNNDDIEKIEKRTRLQSKNQSWRKYRISRITALVAFKVSRVAVPDSNVSLIKSICYGTDIRTKAILWGCRHKKDALVAYLQLESKNHVNLQVHNDDECRI